jgi:hypothetical protein
MNRKIRSTALFVSTFTVIAFGAPGGVLSGAANAGSTINVPARPALPPAAAVNGSANAAASSNAVARPAAASTVQAGSAVPTPVIRGLNANATTHASAEGQANGPAVAEVASNKDQDPATVSMAETVKSIREADFSQRESVTADVQARLDASTRLVGELQAKAETTGERVRRAFGTALTDVRKQEKQLRASLKAGAKATNGSAWGEAQSALARDYEAYAHAVAQAEAAAQGTDDTSTKPSKS